MKRGNVEVICGEGLGKTSLALGKGLSALMEHKRVIMIQFLRAAPQKTNRKSWNGWNRILKFSDLKSPIHFLKNCRKRKKQKN